MSNGVIIQGRDPDERPLLADRQFVVRRLAEPYIPKFRLTVSPAPRGHDNEVVIELGNERTMVDIGLLYGAINRAVSKTRGTPE